MAELDNLQQASQPPAETTVAPSGETLANGPDVNACVRDAIERLTLRPDRDAETGQFVAGNLAPVKTFERSVSFWMELEPLKLTIVSHVLESLNIAPGDSIVAGLVTGYVESKLLRSAMFARLSDTGGPITGKGRTKALYKCFLQALDRETRLAQTIAALSRPATVTPAPVPPLPEEIDLSSLSEDEKRYLIALEEEHEILLTGAIAAEPPERAAERQTILSRGAPHKPPAADANPPAAAPQDGAREAAQVPTPAPAVPPHDEVDRLITRADSVAPTVAAPERRLTVDPFGGLCTHVSTLSPPEFEEERRRALYYGH